ncbi:hypothetical protein [Ruminococcus intestinalis]|uniref:hypothetical protein n=1 Tax=Ruminococcus intestinalis TaxID=2763066 RepID=UPI003F7D106F
MKKRTKLLSAVTAGTMTLGVMCFGFAQWSTEISANGTVSANGKWDVKITDASITKISNGVTPSLEAVTVERTAQVVEYNVILKYVGGVNDPNSKPNGAYMYVIDDKNPQTVNITKDELAEFTAQLMIPRDKRYYTTAVIPGDSGLTNFKVDVDESKSSLINYYRPNVLDTTTYSLHLNDDGANEGVVVGKAIGWLIGGFYKDLDGSVQLTYKAANAALENAESSTTYPAQFTDTTADYGNVNFSINDAWAEYSLTITNNGTVNANLSNYKFNITELSDEFVVDTPNLNNKVLAPGESCTATFVVKVNSEGELSADAQPFSVELTYVQDTVDEAPSASVSK